MRTALCELLGIEQPIVQAPIGTAARPELVAAVSEAGALGMLASSWPADPESQAREVRELTSRPFGVLPLASDEGDVEALSLWAGQSAGIVHDVAPAADIVRRLVAECAAHTRPILRIAGSIRDTGQFGAGFP